MSFLISQCPSCLSDQLQVARIECAQCATRFEGNFQIPALLKLSQDEQRFVVEFVKSSGSLKDMAKQYGVSYPTLRNRLNDLIEHLTELEDRRASEEESILQMLESGKISAKEAALRLKNR